MSFASIDIGMPGNISGFIANVGIVDVHEHHIPDILLNRSVNLLQLFQQSYAGWTQARPYTLPREQRESDPMLAPARPTNWEALAPFLENSRSNSFLRNLVCGITELHGFPNAAITRENWEAVDEVVRARHQEANWFEQGLQRAGIERVITDAYSDPLLDARQALGAKYDSVV